jgi:hypothetical protein
MVGRVNTQRRIEGPMSRSVFEIRAVGEVPRDLLDDFEGATVSLEPGGSTIHVVLGDDAELHGLLAALSREGFALVDVRREPDVEPDND